jgi:hypothetical protein
VAVRTAVTANQEYCCVRNTYRLVPSVLHVAPVAHTPWYLLVFTDNTESRLWLAEVTCFSLALNILYIFLGAVGVFQAGLRRRGYSAASHDERLLGRSTAFLYSLMMTGIALVTGVLPALGIFSVVIDEETVLLTKARQVAFAESLETRRLEKLRWYEDIAVHETFDLTSPRTSGVRGPGANPWASTRPPAGSRSSGTRSSWITENLPARVKSANIPGCR